MKRNTINKRNQRARDKANGLLEKPYKATEEQHKKLKALLRELRMPQGNY